MGLSFGKERSIAMATDSDEYELLPADTIKSLQSDITVLKDRHDKMQETHEKMSGGAIDKLIQSNVELNAQLPQVVVKLGQLATDMDKLVKIFENISGEEEDELENTVNILVEENKELNRNIKELVVQLHSMYNKPRPVTPLQPVQRQYYPTQQKPYPQYPYKT